MTYLEVEETESFRREDYYFAQLTAEVRRSWVKEKKKVSLKEFFIKFIGESKDSKPDAKTVEERTRVSKQFWLGNVIKSNKKSKRKSR